MCFAYLFHCVNMRNYWCFCIMTDTRHDAKRYCHLVQHANIFMWPQQSTQQVKATKLLGLLKSGHIFTAVKIM